MRGAFFLFLVLWAAAGGAQTMYKCVDAQRRVTYSNISCEKQDLKDAGPVAERTTTMPFVPAQKLSPRTEPPKPAATKDDAAGDRSPAQAKPASPPIEKLVK